MIAAKAHSLASTGQTRNLSLASLYQQAHPALFLQNHQKQRKLESVSTAGTSVLNDLWTLHWSIEGSWLRLNFFNHPDGQETVIVKDYTLIIEGHCQFVSDPVVRLGSASTLWLRLTTEDCFVFSFCLALDQLFASSTSSSMALNARQVQLWVPSSLGSESGRPRLCRSHHFVESSTAESQESVVLVFSDGSVQSISPFGPNQRRQQRGIVTVYECSEHLWKFGSSVWNLGKGLILSSLTTLATAHPAVESLDCSSKMVTVGKTGFLITCSSADSVIKVWNANSQSCIKSLPISADDDAEYDGVPKFHVRLFNNGKNALISLLAKQKQKQYSLQVYHSQFEVSPSGVAKLVKLDKVSQSSIDCVESWYEATGVHMNQTSDTQFQITAWFNENSVSRFFHGDFDIQNSKAYIKWKPILFQKPLSGPVASISLLRYSQSSALVFSSIDGFGFFQLVDSVSLWHGLCLKQDSINVPSDIEVSPAALQVMSEIYKKFVIFENIVGQICKDSDSITVDSLMELGDRLTRIVPAHALLSTSALSIENLKAIIDKIVEFDVTRDSELPPIFKIIDDENAVYAVYQFSVSLIAALTLKMESVTQSTKLKLVAMIKRLSSFVFPLSFYAKIEGFLSIEGSLKSEISCASDCLRKISNKGSVSASVMRNLPKQGLFVYIWTVYYIQSQQPVKARVTVSDLYQVMSVDSDAAADVYKLLGFPLDHWNVVQFLRHVTKLFSENMYFDEALHFASLARQKVESLSIELTDRNTLQIELFTYAMDLHRFDAAYTALLKINDSKQFKVHLSHFIAQVAQYDLNSLMSKYPFPGHEVDVENVLQKKAVSSSWNSTPNYYQIVFAYYVKRNDYKSASFWMHMHAEAISRALDLAPFPSVIRQCQAHIVTITCLELLPKEDQWIPTSTPIAPSSIEAGKPAITLQELRKMYILKMSKLELKSQDKYPNLDVSVPLRPEHTLSLCSNAKMWDRAMSIADQFDLEPNLESLEQIS